MKNLEPDRLLSFTRAGQPIRLLRSIQPQHFRNSDGVRYFNKQTELHRPSDAMAESPNLFGWHLDREVLGFLQATGAVLDVDEYDMTPDYAED
jgi:hypothetical protein